MTGWAWAALIAFPELFLSPSSFSGVFQPVSVLYRFHHPAVPASGWAAAYGRPYGVSGLHYLALGWGKAQGFLGVEDFGEREFGESTLYAGLRFSRPVTSALTLRLTSLRGSGDPWRFALDGGFAFEALETRFAFTVRGLWGTDPTPPSALLSGAWRLFPGVSTFFGLRLVAGGRPQVLTGAQVAVARNLAVTTGLRTAPAVYFTAWRFGAGPFTFAYALSFHAYLGFSHTVELSVSWGRHAYGRPGKSAA